MLGLRSMSLVQSATLVFVILGCVFTAASQEPVSANEMPATLIGTVSDETGPVSGERIVVFRLGADHGRPAMVHACASVTGFAGTYRCEGLSAGEYLVVVMESLQRERGQTSRKPAFLFYGNTGDLDKAVHIQLSSNDYQAANFFLSGIDTYEIRGKLSAAISKAEIDLEAIADSGWECLLPLRPIRGDTGQFLFPKVPTGRYRLHARSTSGMKDVDAYTEIDVVNHDVSLVSLEETKKIDVKLSLRSEEAFDSHQPASRVTEIYLEQIDTGVRIGGAMDKTKSGSYVFPAVDSGSYLLSLGASSTACIGTISSAGREIANPLGIGGNNPQLAIEGTIRSVCGSLRGVLSTPTKGEILLTTDAFVPLATITSDESGKFAFGGLVPGEYRIYAWPSMRDIPFRNRLFLRSLRDRSTPIAVSEGELTVQTEIPSPH